MSFTDKNSLETILRNLDDQKLLDATLGSAEKEQAATLDLLVHLHEVNLRKVFASVGHSSLWDYCVKTLGYSESGASERVGAMRLLYSVPEAKAMLETGKLTLTTAAQAQRFFQNEARHFEKKYTVEAKREVLHKIAGASKREAEKVLLSISPEHKILVQEKVRIVSEQETELRFLANPEFMKMLSRMKELKGETPLQKLFELVLKEWLERNDPLEKLQKKAEAADPASPAPPAKMVSKGLFPEKVTSRNHSRYIPAAVKRETWLRSQGQCEWRSERGDRCGSMYRLQYDHRLPFALNGTSEAGNIRHLCTEHNARAAVEAFGRVKSDLLRFRQIF